MPSDEVSVLANAGNTDFLQAVSLFHTRQVCQDAEAMRRKGNDLPKISATRKTLLDLPLSAYLRYQGVVEEGFLAATKFLVKLGIYWVQDLPYQSQVVPLAAQGKVTRWFWNGVFGELYGSSKETRIAHDFVEVVQWIKGDEEPSTVHDSTVRADRFKSLRSRIPAAYKGVSGLLTNQGAQDFRTGQSYNHTIFFDENVDIHHVFPQDWCKKQGIPASDYDSVINKTPLSARTNRIIGGVAPSTYLKELNGGLRYVRLRSCPYSRRPSSEPSH